MVSYTLQFLLNLLLLLTKTKKTKQIKTSNITNQLMTCNQTNCCSCWWSFHSLPCAGYHWTCIIWWAMSVLLSRHHVTIRQLSWSVTGWPCLPFATTRSFTVGSMPTFATLSKRAAGCVFGVSGSGRVGNSSQASSCTTLQLYIKVWWKIHCRLLPFVPPGCHTVLLQIHTESTSNTTALTTNRPLNSIDSVQFIDQPLLAADNQQTTPLTNEETSLV